MLSMNQHSSQKCFKILILSDDMARKKPSAKRNTRSTKSKIKRSIAHPTNLGYWIPPETPPEEPPVIGGEKPIILE